MKSKQNPKKTPPVPYEGTNTNALPDTDPRDIEAIEATEERTPQRPEPAHNGSPKKVRNPMPSTTLEDIARADGEGMAPVPPPRPEAPKPHEQKSSQGY